MRSSVLLAVILAFAASYAFAATKVVRRHRHSLGAQATTPVAPDDLYRRRGYGIGGAAFGLGLGGTDMAGACADLRFAEPRTCGHGYGVYGNGLGYGFGF